MGEKILFWVMSFVYAAVGMIMIIYGIKHERESEKRLFFVLGGIVIIIGIMLCVMGFVDL